MRSDDTYSIIVKINSAMNDFIMNELRRNSAEGMVSSHGNILMVLYQYGVLSMNELAEKIGKTPQTVTTLVQKLIVQGYIETKKNEEDRRITMVQLTQKGKDFEPVFIQISEDVFKTQYKGMSEEEINSLRGLLNKLLNNFTK